MADITIPGVPGGFCVNCGSKTLPTAKFCLSCGNPVVSNTNTTATIEKSKSAPPQNGSSNEKSKHGVQSWDESHLKITEGLKVLYESKLKNIEAAYRFEQFHSPLLTDADFDAKPTVLLLGQYSVGKTSFIQYLLERDFPGQRIGPEPTTDRFVAVMHGEDERVIPGNALAVQNDMPYRALQKYGMGFLNKFEGAFCPSPILKKISFIDTPGVLSGEKQRVGRTYDFSEVIEWFAHRCDRILLLFDAHKLDISDEFKRVIETLKGHDDKIRVVLNKSDQINNQQLMRVYGALMWSLGKVIKTPEVLRVYIGSFWDKDYKNIENKALFEAEKADLLGDLRSLPRNSAVRKVNELVKRSRCAKVHAYIVAYMVDQFSLFFKESKQEELLTKIPEIFKAVADLHNLPVGDFPNPNVFRDIISKFKIWEFPSLNKKQIKSVDDVLSSDIPNLLKLLPAPEADNTSNHSLLNPFDEANVPTERNWVVSGPEKLRYDNIFHTLPSDNDKVKGADCRRVFMQSGLSNEQLKVIWGLCDFQKRGALDSEEFAIAMYLCDSVKSGEIVELPNRLPVSMIPPNKRSLVPHALYE